MAKRFWLFARKIIRRCYALCENWFLKQILVVPDGHIKKICELLKTHVEQHNFSKRSSIIMLDIGSSFGRWYMLSQATKMKCRYIAVDLADPKYMDIKKDVIYCRANAEELSFKDNSADIVVTFELLEHCRFPEKVLEEIYRVLKGGGLLICTTRQYWKTHHAPKDYFRFTRAGLEAMLHSSGFATVEASPMGGPASIIATVIDQNIPLLSRPVVKQLFIYPLWFLATLLDRIFFLSKESFVNAPDTTGWLVAATKGRILDFSTSISESALFNKAG